MNNHLTEQDIQQLAEGLKEGDPGSAGHLEVCPACKAKYTMYTLLFSEMNRNHSQVVPEIFADRVLKVIARKQEQKMMYADLLFYGAIVGISLTGFILSVPDTGIKNMLNGFRFIFAGGISGAETVLVMAVIGLLYICLSLYKNRFTNKNLLSDITF